MDSPAKIDIKNLNLFIGRQQILKDINVAIPEKQITVILGPSGCGKTTLLKCLNRLTDIYPEMKVQGQIFIDVYVIIEYGTRIVTVARSVMNVVKYSVERALGVPVAEVNVYIEGLRISDAD